MRLIITNPHNVILTIIVLKKFVGKMSGIIFISPNPPIFNKIAARNIDPATGASTWALGSHIWKKQMGNFTKNLNLTLNPAKVIVILLKFQVSIWNRWEYLMLNCEVKIRSRGIELEIV